MTRILTLFALILASTLERHTHWALTGGELQ